jgi:hypothetical protein
MRSSFLNGVFVFGVSHCFVKAGQGLFHAAIRNAVERTFEEIKSILKKA